MTENGKPDPLESLSQSLAEGIVKRGIRADLGPGIVEQIAKAVVQELLERDRLSGLIREIVLQVELEHENIRRGGIGPAILWHLRKAGINIYLKDGKIMAGPREAITPILGRFISGFRYEIMAELNR